MMNAEPSADPGAAMPPIRLAADEIELIDRDLEALLPTLDGARRDRYAALRDAVIDGQVPGSLAPALESLLELTLQTARARTRYRAEGEQTLTRVYARTPGGRQLARHLEQVNGALRSLAGQTLESIGVRQRTVGHFTVTIQTDGATLTLAARPDSVDVESIAVNG